jgi:hypothetical protein
MPWGSGEINKNGKENKCEKLKMNNEKRGIPGRGRERGGGGGVGGEGRGVKNLQSLPHPNFQTALERVATEGGKKIPVKHRTHRF